MTDSDLLIQWANRRDPEAFREVVNRHAAMVYGTCKRIVRDAAEAEDVTQECFEALAKAGTRPGAYLGAWLHRVATNLALRNVRGAARRRTREAAYAETPAPEVPAEWHDAYAFVDEALNALPEHLRAPLVLYYLENQTQEAIADALGVARTTVTYRIGQGLDRVRKSLRKRGVTMTAGALAALGASSSSMALPPTLTASLGRLAIAGAELLPAATTGLGVLSGLVSLKGLVPLIIVIALGLAGYKGIPLVKPLIPAKAAPSAAPLPESSVTKKDVALAAAPASSAMPPETAAPGIVNISGTLSIDGTNTPCRDMTIIFKSEATGKEWRTQSEKNGSFHLKEALPGVYHVFLDDSVRALKNLPVTMTVPADKPDFEVPLVVDAGASISGRVFNKESGEGIYGTGINIAPLTGDETSVSVCGKNHNQTGPEGQYRFEGIQPGKYRVFLDSEIFVADAQGNVQYQTEIAGGGPVTDLVVKGREKFENIDFPILLSRSTLRGMVLDSHGKPADGAYVEAVSVGGRQSTQAKVDGSFFIKGLPASNECYLIARAGREACEIMGPLTLPESGLDGLQIQLKPGGVIRGTLTDAAGAPLVGATLNAFPGYRAGVGTAAANTGPDGLFEFTALPKATYEIRLIQLKPNTFVNSNSLGTIEVKEGQTTENVTLVYKELPAAPQGSLSIAGRVADAANQPIPGVQVSAAPVAENGISPWADHQAWTDAEGLYRIDGLEKKPYSLSAGNGDYSTSRRESVEGGSTKVDFVLQPRITVEGKVISAEDNRPVPQFEITISGVRPTQVADPEGRFQCPKIDVAGYCAFTIKAPGFIDYEQSLQTEPGKDIKDLRIALQRSAGLAGRVINAEGQPVSGARIFLDKSFDHTNFRDETAVIARSDADGAFQIPALPNSKGFVVAFHTEYATGYARYRPGITSIEILLPIGGAIEGIVTAEGAPVAGAEVAVSPAVWSTKSFWVPMNTRTGPDGTFRFDQVIPGSVMVSLALEKEVKNPADMRMLSRRLTVESGKTTSITLDLPATNAGIEGQVRVAGNPIPMATVLFTAIKDDMEIPSFAQTDENGFYRIANVPAGTGTLRVTVPLMGTMTCRNVEIPMETLAGQVVRQDIDIQDANVIAANLQGVVPSENTIVSILVFPADLHVSTLEDLQNMQIQGKAVAATVVKNDGPVRLEMLPPGAYTVAALMSNFSKDDMGPTALAFSTITVENGVEASLDLTLQSIQE